MENDVADLDPQANCQIDLEANLQSEMHLERFHILSCFRHSRGRQKQSGESHCLSRYYREHFGSHSPEMYMNLRISGFLPSLNKEGVIDILEEELKKMAPFEVRMIVLSWFVHFLLF